MSTPKKLHIRACISKSVHNVIKYKHIANFFTTYFNDLVDKINTPFDRETIHLETS
jgi:hypothetical protein